MIYSYNSYLLENATSCFGTFIEYIACNTKHDLNSFLNEFSKLNICKQLEIGNPVYVLGKNGVDIYIDMVYELTGKYKDVSKNIRTDFTKEYWAGYSICYYQWYTRRKYKEIFDALDINRLIQKYNPLHEADITKTLEFIDDIVIKNDNRSRLKKLRKSLGISQKELSTISGVGLRSIQMYEEKYKDINKASVETLYRLAESLYCSIEDLLEPNICNFMEHGIDFD